MDVDKSAIWKICQQVACGFFIVRAGFYFQCDSTGCFLVSLAETCRVYFCFLVHGLAGVECHVA